MNDPVVLVTGGGRNLGRAIAMKLSGGAGGVAILGPDQDELEQAAEELRETGARVCDVVADLREPEQITEAISQFERTLGPIDVLVNNSGIAGPTAALGDIDLDEWNDCLAINLTGAFLCGQAVVGGMIERRRGKIINISSIAGRIGYPLRSPYVASKWALIGLTRTWAKELGPHNIQVNAICPGPVAGRRMDEVIANYAQETGRDADEVRETYYLANSPLHRMVTQDDIAAMAAYLVSPAGDNITGQALEVTAGYALS